jgi:hypothetical protein
VYSNDWIQGVYGGWLTTYVNHSNSSSLIPFTIENFRKIAYADSVNFVIFGKDDSMKGELNNSDLEYFKIFDKQCLLSQ